MTAIERAAEAQKCRVETAVYSDGRIKQTVEWFGHAQRFVVDTREEGIKKALIELGWTPPPRCQNTMPFNDEESV